MQNDNVRFFWQNIPGGVVFFSEFPEKVLPFHRYQALQMRDHSSRGGPRIHVSEVFNQV